MKIFSQNSCIPKTKYNNLERVIGYTRIVGPRAQEMWTRIDNAASVANK